MRFRTMVIWGLVLCAGHVLATAAGAEGPTPIAPEKFDKLSKLIKPHQDENRFWQIPWLLSIWEARQKAAAEGKPILVWSGSQGAPIGGC